MKHHGFTLAELLIALALLGIIAAFTIPKVLQSSAENERVAKLRETVAALENAWYSIRLENQFTPNFAGPIIFPRLNCVSTTYRPPPSYDTCVFPTGVTIDITSQAGYSLTEWLQPVAGTPTATISIDINGAASPNQYGQDRFQGNFHPWGDFDSNAAAVYTPKEGQKSFHWGSSTDVIYDTGGAITAVPPEEQVGTWLTR